LLKEIKAEVDDWASSCEMAIISKCISLLYTCILSDKDV
jgi:hypothetical protein